MHVQKRNALRWIFVGIGLAALIFFLTRDGERFAFYIPSLDWEIGYAFFNHGWGYFTAAAMVLFGAYRWLTAPKI